MRTIGVVQGGGDHYPFVDPSDDIKGVVADISIGLNKEVLSVAIQGLVVEDSVEICLVDENDTVLFNSTDGNYDRKEDREWGGYYRIVYWESRDLQVKLVLYQTSRYLEIQPENGLLDLRTVFVKPPHVSSITIIDRDGNRHYCNEKKIIFREGYNVDLSIESTNTNVRRQSTLILDAGAGYGAGRTPCASDDPEYRVVRSINSVTTEDGSMTFIPEDGYGFELSPRTAKIYVYNTDTPCCSCDEMEDLSDYVADVAKKYWEISEDVNDLRDQHEKNIKNWVKKSPTNPKITRDPFMLQVVGDGCQNVVIRADFTNHSSEQVSANISLVFNSFRITRKSVTLPTRKTSVITYQENGIKKTKTVSKWIMHTTTTSSNDTSGSVLISTSHLDPGKTMSIQLMGLYEGYRFPPEPEDPEEDPVPEPMFQVNGFASAGDGTFKTLTASVNCSCSYSAYTVSDITNKSAINSMYHEVWNIKQRVAR